MKYKVIMAAQLRYESLATGDAQYPVPKAILACGSAFPVELREFAEYFDVEIKSSLVVPEGFVPKKETLGKGATSSGAA